MSGGERKQIFPNRIAASEAKHAATLSVSLGGSDALAATGGAEPPPLSSLLGLRQRRLRESAAEVQGVFSVSRLHVMRPVMFIWMFQKQTAGKNEHSMVATASTSSAVVLSRQEVEW